MTNSVNVADCLVTAASRWPDATALIDSETALSYSDLLTRAEAHARRIWSLDLARGTRVAVVLDKSVEAVAFLFGCFLAEVTVVPINPRLKRLQVEHILSDSDARLIAVMANRKSFHDRLELPGLSIALLVQGERAEIRKAAVQSRLEFDEELPPEVAVLFYTSGSTGMPKAVMSSHPGINAGAESVASYLENTCSDRILAILPLSFDAGFSQLTTGFGRGATIVLQDYLLPRDIPRACEQYHITGITGVPAIWNAALSAKWSESARRRIRYFANTGGHLPQIQLNRLRELFPMARAFPMYGLTEAFRSTYLDPDCIDSRPGSIGKAIPGAQVVVVNSEGEECAAGEIGELVHAGPTVAVGYWKSPKATAQRFRPAPPCLRRKGVNGRVAYSGDLARRDEDGFLYFVSRADKQLKVLGNRISLEEIENTTLKCPGVTSCAVGALEIDGGDPELVLFFSGENDPDLEDRLRTWCRCELPSFMLPKQLVRREELLLSVNGKYDVSRMVDELRNPEYLEA